MIKKICIYVHIVRITPAKLKKPNTTRKTREAMTMQKIITLNFTHC